jgi:hypothetical protein
LRFEVSPPPDGEPVIAWAHDACFSNLRHSSVEYDDPKDHGRIPPRACCAFCGQPLPIIGRHPFVLDVGAFIPPHRFWAHGKCIVESMVPELVEQLTGARETPD